MLPQIDTQVFQPNNPASLAKRAGTLKEVYNGKGKDVDKRAAIQRRLQKYGGSGNTVPTP